MNAGIVLLAVLILASGFFSGAEIALFSLSRSKIRALQEQKRKNAKGLALLKENPEKLLITILIGNNLINIGSSSLATVIALEKFGSAGVGIATGVMTFLILYFGEIIPKSLAQRYAVGFGLFISPFMRILMMVMSPVTALFHFLTIGFQRVFRMEGTPLLVSEEDVRAMVDLGHEEGQLETDEKEMIEKVFLLNDIHAEDVMTPEEFIVSFPYTMTLEEAIPVIQETGFSRFPITSTSEGRIDGVLYIKDVFRYIAQHALDGSMENAEIFATEVNELMKPPLFVPDSRRVDELMKDFQEERRHIAIVVDEHGTTLGVVTFEDLLEEVVGEIEDESDAENEMIEQLGEHSFMLDPRVNLRKINAHASSELPGPKAKTIGWLVLKEFGRIPSKGDAVTIQGYRFIVEEADDRRIKRVKMVKTAEAKHRTNKQNEENGEYIGR